MKSFRPVAEDDDDSDNGSHGYQDFHGERGTNDTHRSRTDPGARIFKKGPGKEARLAYLGHVAIENRNGLVVQAELTRPMAMPSGRRPSPCWRGCAAAIASP